MGQPLQPLATTSSQVEKVEEQIQSTAITSHRVSDYNDLSFENFKRARPDYVLSEKETKWLTKFFQSDYIPTERNIQMVRSVRVRDDELWKKIASDPQLVKQWIFWTIEYLTRDPDTLYRFEGWL